MRRIGFLFLIILAILLLSTCEQFDPQWDGFWVDDSTVPNAVITLDFSKWSGRVTVDNGPDADVPLTIVDGYLDGDENTLVAEITRIYQKYKDGSELLATDPIEIYAIVITPPDDVHCPFCLGLDWPCSVTYEIEGDTIILTGDLIFALTGKVSNQLTATKQGILDTNKEVIPSLISPQK
jgi:hypothetical protein